VEFTDSPWWLLAVSAGSLFGVLGTVLAWLRARPVGALPLTGADLSITVMKPLAGLEPRLVENLESFARLVAPPSFEVLLCLPDERDAACAVARDFVDRYPHRFRLTCGVAPRLANGKIAQLVSAWPLAKNDFIWVSEANVETSQAFLEALVTTWKRANAQGRVKTLVHAPLVGVHGVGLGAALERLHLSSLQNPNHELALLLGNTHAVVGKTEFFHRDDVLALGGLQAFGNYLGEDFLLGVAFAREGVVICSPVATRNVIGALSLRGWVDRHARWGVIRKTLMRPAFFALEPQLHLALPTVLTAFGLAPPWLLGLLVGVRVALDGANFALQTGEWPRWSDLLLVPFKEAAFTAWATAAASSHVKWRADSIRVGADSLVVPAPVVARGARE
jgi:ceramide glucosyltransferase